MEKPGLVACDLDGTLLGAAGKASQRTVEMVARVVASGVPFVLVTGRPPRWVPPVVAELGYAGLAVCANGAVLYDAARDRVLSSHTLAPVALRDVVQALDEALPGCMLAVERAGETALPAEHEFVAELDYAHPWPSPDSRHAARGELLGRPAVKLLVRHPEMASDAMAAVAVAVAGDAASVTWSTRSGLIELSAPGVSKGSGLAAVALRFGALAENVIAFGDMPNDLPMLAWAGHGVAMANAHADVLAAADEVTAPNTEDGVAMVLERWFSG